ncbi:MAG: replicative DNA helicase [Candidatus Nanopelagicaceae bacterium]
MTRVAPKKVEPDDLSIIQNSDLEMNFLGQCICNPDVVPAYVWLPIEAFWLDDHRKVWSAIVALHKAGQRCELTRLALQLTDMGLFSTAEAKSRVTYILDASMAYRSSVETIDPYFKALLEVYRKRRLDEFTYQLRAKIRIPNQNWKAEIQDEFSDIFRDSESAESQFVNMAEFVDDGLESECISTGLTDLDTMLDGGIKKQELTILAARASMGKTLLMCWLALSAAYKQRQTFIFSAEMSTRKLRHRWLSCLCGFPYASWRYVPDDRKAYGEEQFQKASPFISVNDLSSTVDGILASLNREFMRQKIDMVFIDHLHEIITGSDNQATDLASYFCTELRRLAKRNDCAIVLLAQINRGVESRQDKRPTKSDIRQFGAIEQIADLMLMLYRDEYYDPQTIDKNVTEVLTVKNRDGRTGPTKVLCDISTNRYYDLTPDNCQYLSQHGRA